MLRNAAPLRVVDGDGEKRSPGRPKGYPKSGGRKPGVKNRISADVKESIIVDGKPLETLFAIARGNRMKAGDPSDPTKKVYVYPTLADRQNAARTLLAKVVPDLKAQELSGNPERPLFPAVDPDGSLNPDVATARRIAFLLAQGMPADSQPRRASEDDTAAQDFRRAINKAVDHPAPDLPPRPPLEPNPPPPGTRRLGEQFQLPGKVLLHFDGYETDGLTERWHVLDANGAIKSTHPTLAAAESAGRQ